MFSMPRVDDIDIDTGTFKIQLLDLTSSKFMRHGIELKNMEKETCNLVLQHSSTFLCN